MKGWLALTLVALCGLVRAAEIVVNAANSPYALTAAENKASNSVRLEDGAVLQLPSLDVRVEIDVADNGAAGVTLDFSPLADASRAPRFYGRVVSPTTTFRIKGSNTVDVGLDVNDARNSVAGKIWYVPTMEYLDAEGAAYANPGGVRFVGMSYIFGVAAPCAIAPGARIYVGRYFQSKTNVIATNPAETLFADPSQVTVEGYDLMLLDDKTLPDGATITVCKNGVLRLKALWMDGTGFSNLGKASWPHHVVLNSEGVGEGDRRPQLWFQTNGETKLTKSLTGDGDFGYDMGGANNSANCNAFITGPVECTGNILVADRNQRLTLGISTNGAHFTSIDVCENAFVRFTRYSSFGGTVVADSITDRSTISLAPNMQMDFPWPTHCYEDGQFTTYVKATERVDLNSLRRNNAQTVVHLNADATVEGLTDDTNLRIASNTTASLTMPPSEKAIVSVEPNATVQIQRPEEPSWRDVAALWFDPNDASTIDGLGTHPLSAAYAALLTAPLNTTLFDGKLVEYMRDCRADHTMYNGYNSRLYFKDAISRQYQCYLVASNDTTVGRTCLYGGTLNDAKTTTGKYYCSDDGTKVAQQGNDGRRLPFSQGLSVGGISAQYLIMAFNASNGGGYEIMGTESGQFLRTDKTQAGPIMDSGAYDVWVNGEKVDPTTRALSGGWQIITVNCKGVKLLGPGWTKGAYANSGGQCWGDILVFTNQLTELQRQEAEAELMARWCTAADADKTAQPVARPLSLTGTGVVDVPSNVGVDLHGNFSGTLNLTDGYVEINDWKLPYTEDEIPSEDRVAWFNPDDPATAKVDPKKESWLKDYKLGNDGNTAMYAGGSRIPHLVLRARGLGMEHTWIDYNDTYELKKSQTNKGNQGNTMRLVANPTSSTEQTWDVQTVFQIMDSERGGGTPFALDIDAKGKTTIRLRSTTSAFDPIFASGSASTYTGGGIWLNGETRANASGFTGQPELFTFTATESFPLLCFAQYVNSEVDVAAWNADHATKKGNWNGEFQGETILFNSELEADVRNGINAYLMGKWLGRLPEGYADARQATIAGRGTVRVAKMEQRPRFADTFAGQISFAGGVWSVMPNADGSVTGAIDVPDADLAGGPLDGVVSIPASAKIKAGEWTLARFRSWENVRGFALDPAFVAAHPTARLDVSGTALKLVVVQDSTLVIIR